MANRLVTIDEFDGGIYTFGDPNDIGTKSAQNLVNFDIDKFGSLISRKPFKYEKTFDDLKFHGAFNWVDVSNNDLNQWIFVDDFGKYYLYIDGTWAASSGVTNPILDKATSAGNYYDFYSDGNIVRVANGIADYPQLIQHINSRSFFYGAYVAWDATTANSGWWFDNARPAVNSTNYPFTIKSLSTDSPGGGSGNTDDRPDRTVGNLSYNKNYYYKAIPVFDGNQELPLSTDSNKVIGSGVGPNVKPGDADGFITPYSTVGTSVQITLNDFIYSNTSGSPEVTTNKWNPRITAVKLYRHDSAADTPELKPVYRLIKTFPLDSVSGDKNSETRAIANMAPLGNDKFVLIDCPLKDYSGTVYPKDLGSNVNTDGTYVLHASFTDDDGNTIDGEWDISDYSNGVFTVNKFYDDSESFMPDFWNATWKITQPGAGNESWFKSGTRLCAGQFLMKLDDSLSITTDFDGDYDNCLITYESGSPAATYNDVIVNSAMMKKDLTNHQMLLRVAGFSLPETTATTEYTIHKNNMPIAYTVDDSSADKTVSITMWDTGLTPGRQHPMVDVGNDVKYKVQHSFMGRNWVGNVKVTDDGVTETHQNGLMYSLVDQPDNIPTSNFMKLVDIQGGQINGISSIGQDLVVLSSKGIFKMRSTSSDPNSFAVRESIQDLGCVSAASVCESQGRIFFAGENDYYMITPNFDPLAISKPIRDIYRNMKTSISTTQAVYDSTRERLIVKIGNLNYLFVCFLEDGFSRWVKMAHSNAAIDTIALSQDGDLLFVNNQEFDNARYAL
jgi:hypothetical protein